MYISLLLCTRKILFYLFKNYVFYLFTNFFQNFISYIRFYFWYLHFSNILQFLHSRDYRLLHQRKSLLFLIKKDCLRFIKCTLLLFVCSGKNVLNQKSELQRALEKQREAASRREAERIREESYKDDPRTALQRAIEQRARHIQLTVIQDRAQLANLLLCEIIISTYYIFRFRILTSKSLHFQILGRNYSVFTLVFFILLEF